MKSNAWLLHFGAGAQAAVGLRDVLHLLPQTECFAVPCTPVHCAEALVWQGRIVPVWNMAAWLDLPLARRSQPITALVGYQLPGQSDTRFGALVLAAPPQRIEVADSQACALPAGTTDWRAVAVSCFRQDEQAVPILDLARIFAPDHFGH
jgi:chemotaxis signal transduction protein